MPPLAFQSHTLAAAAGALPVLPMAEVVTSYYLRIRVADEAGVLAQDHQPDWPVPSISIDAVLQREADEVGGEGVDADRPDHPHPRYARGRHGRGPGANPGPAFGAGPHHPHSQRRVELMRYLSTRGHADRKRFCDILLEGLAPDGGLYLPESYPQISDASAWASCAQIYAEQGYAALAFEILSLYIDDIPADDLRALCAKTYTEAVFGSAAIVPGAPAGRPAARSKPCPTAPRWPSRTWPCSCWATCLSTNWPAGVKR